MYDRISFFWNANKTLGSLGKIRVGRVTGNTHIFFFGLRDTVIQVLLFLLIYIVNKNIKGNFVLFSHP